MRQIARILLTNDFKNENISLQLKLDQCLKKLIFWGCPMPLCRPIFGIIFRQSEWGIICESLNLLVIQKNTVMFMYFYFITTEKGNVPCQGNLGLKISRFSCMIQPIENAYNSVINGSATGWDQNGRRPMGLYSPNLAVT